MRSVLRPAVFLALLLAVGCVSSYREQERRQERADRTQHTSGAEAATTQRRADRNQGSTRRRASTPPAERSSAWYSRGQASPRSPADKPKGLCERPGDVGCTLEGDAQAAEDPSNNKADPNSVYGGAFQTDECMNSGLTGVCGDTASGDQGTPNWFSME